MLSSKTHSNFRGIEGNQLKDLGQIFGQYGRDSFVGAGQSPRPICHCGSAKRLGITIPDREPSMKEHSPSGSR